MAATRHGRDDDPRKNGADGGDDARGYVRPRGEAASPGSDAGNLPSALEHFDEVSRQIDGKQPALFLDYDGTLTPIVDRPEDAGLPGRMRDLLRTLASLCRVAIISGRDLRDVRDRVGLEILVYAGSHGFDIAGPNDVRMQHAGGKNCLPALDEAERRLRRLIEPTAGAQLERKRFSIAVHYRNAAAGDIGRIEAIVDDVLAGAPRLRKGLGKKVIELRPNVDWDKGKALMWLMSNTDADRPDILPLYLGDDITDEDAFAVLRDRGVGILVGRHGEPSAAKFGLKNVPEVRRFLNKFADFLKEKKK